MNLLTLCPLKSPTPMTVKIPGSKSYTIRALLLAAMAEKTAQQPSVKILNPLRSDDTLAIIACLNSLGLCVEWKAASDNDRSNPASHLDSDCWLEVTGNLDSIPDTDYQLDANLSAATLRFLLALSAVIPGKQTLFGLEGLNRRPVRDLVDSLRALGVSIDYLNQEGYPPVRVNSSSIEADSVRVSGSTSSQYISALMMISPRIHSHSESIVIELTDEPVSKPYLDMTASIMGDFSVSLSHTDHRRFVIPTGQTVKSAVYSVEPDASSMAYFLAIAALSRSTVTIPHLNSNSVQADMRFIKILESMGNTVEWHDDRLTLHGQGVQPLQLDMRDCPDQAQTLAVLAAFAPGTTRIDGLQSLRVKETDRIAAVERELRKMGIQTESEADALIIHGGHPQAARIETYGDHRMAMAFAVAGASGLSGLTIEDPAVVNKTYPGFWNDLESIGMPCLYDAADETQPDKQPPKIVLIGFMGSGKSTVALLLAQKLGLESVEMDDLILARSGRSTINEIFEQDGEVRFRELELAVAQTLRDKTGVVISTGGGVVMNQLAVQYLSQANGRVVFLETFLETILFRLKGAEDRPLLKRSANFAGLESLYTLRLPLYRHYAQSCVSTDGRTPDAIVESLMESLALSPGSCNLRKNLVEPSIQKV